MAARKLKDTGGISRQTRRRKRQRVAKDRWRKAHMQKLRIIRTAESAAKD